MKRTGDADQGVESRRLAIRALRRVFEDRAYANLVVPRVLDDSALDARDRALVTELAYGATRRARACDWLVDRFISRDVEPEVRATLRVGAYQLAFTDIPQHAAVSTTVAAAPPRARGFVNAVLRKVAASPREWPDEATRLSYPDWIVDLLDEDLGHDVARSALEAMNRAVSATVRADGYVQDEGSRRVAELVEACEGQRVADLCSAPGGKAIWMARTGAQVVALDQRPARAGLVAQNVARTAARGVTPVVGDALHPPLRSGGFEWVLVDAPCSGLGVLHRRPDARWRAEADEIERLAALQRSMVEAAVDLLASGGVLVYSVCTLSRAETRGIDEHLAQRHPELEPLAAPAEPWQPLGRGALLLPQAAGTDGMMVLRLRRGA